MQRPHPPTYPLGSTSLASSARRHRSPNDAPTHDRDGTFPRSAFERLGALGVLRFSVDERQGGFGATNTHVAWLLERVGAADPAVGFLLALHLQFVRRFVDPAGPWPQPARHAVRDSLEAGFGLLNAFNVEPELGTSARGGLPATMAHVDPATGGWLLTGHKIYSSGAPGLRWYVVSARTETRRRAVGRSSSTRRAQESSSTRRGTTSASVPPQVTTSISTPPPCRQASRRSSRRRRPTPRSAREWGSLGVAPVYQGAALAAREWLLRYLGERTPTNLGAPLATLPRVQEIVGQIEALLFTNRRLIDALATRLDAGSIGEDAGIESGLTKHLTIEHAVRSVELGLGLVGNPGLRRANPLERHYRNVFTARVHTPQSDTVLVGAGRAALAAALVSASGAAPAATGDQLPTAGDRRPNPVEEAS